jgi:hypothetical protein
MTKDEYTSLYFGAIIVMSMQITVLTLITHQMLSDDFKLMKSGDFLVNIPRMISTTLMHMIVEPEIRSGINLMKYCVNHPHMFRNAVDKNNEIR